MILSLTTENTEVKTKKSTEAFFLYALLSFHPIYGLATALIYLAVRASFITPFQLRP